MNIAFFTPVIKTSAIGRSAKAIVGEIANLGNDVTVVRTESTHLFAQPSWDFNNRVIDWSDRSSLVNVLGSADAIVYEIGDNFEYHCGCLEWMGRFPGVVCLHDFFLGNLFMAWGADRRSEAQSLLRFWYGEEAASTYLATRLFEEFIERTHAFAPMTEWVCSQATAVVTHSSWGIDRVLSSCPGPVMTIPLAYDAPVLHGRAACGTDQTSDLRVLTFGQINSNKRVEDVIDAIGQSALRQRLSYRLVGKIDPHARRQLTDAASRRGVTLEIVGEAELDQLMDAIVEADVICCLRLPCLEAASASAIEAMQLGKAVVVVDHGFL